MIVPAQYPNLFPLGDGHTFPVLKMDSNHPNLCPLLELVKQNLEKMGGFNLLLLRDEVQDLMYHKLAGAS